MREDEAIRDDVIAELESDPEITDAARIGVSVHNGVVTLTGSVSSYPQRLAAEKAARRVDGVKAVANDVEVRLPTAGIRSDTDIAEAAVNALRWDVQVPDERIQVTVHEGWVTLEGDVDYWYQKQAAERDVRSLQGVKGVINNIRVMAPRISPAEVKSKIEQAFERSAELDARRINVETYDGKLVLTGKVRSLAEKEEAEAVAWSTRGVSEVENRIVVSP
ncbi:MAG: BON domain-containing protein [Anaerolineae bacterium]|nr:BON domain-containing protein [Anaerolineae bacterium]